MNTLCTDYDAITPIHAAITQCWFSQLVTRSYTPHLVHHIGCRDGSRTAILQARYPKAQVIGIDDEPWVSLAKQRHPTLPFMPRTVPQTENPDWIVLEQCLQSMQSWHTCLENCYHNLKTMGQLSIITFGKNTLQALQSAFKQAPDFQDMHDIGDACLKAGFTEIVMSAEMFTLSYASLDTLAKDAYALFEQELELNADQILPLQVELEVIYGHAIRAPSRTGNITYVQVPKR